MEAGRIVGLGVEWDAVRALLAGEARTAMGRDRAAAADPFADLAAVPHALAATTEARRALAEAGAPPLEAIADIRGILARAGLVGSVLDGPELRLIVPMLAASPRLRAYGRGLPADVPGLRRLTDSLPAAPELLATLQRSIDEEGAVTDEASPRLRQLRREIREHRRRVVAELERLLRGPDADRLFADRYVTVRHGRYVVPVRAEARSRVRGIVHDRSQSGQTVFVEPEAVVEANNDLVQREREEEAETARVLGELSDAVRSRLADLDALVAGLAELDWTFARAHLAERMGGSAPIVGGARAVSLRAARHPLLCAQQWRDPARPVVPADLEVSAERPVLLVTGPNAGGKTVALKTLGLHALMAQVGCHLPAAPGSRLPLFTTVHALIGDEQSVAENLSTFSAFVKQVRDLLATADAGSLVLLDELGAGTDPDDGAALAQAILEDLAERGALVMATTHLEPLKAFASTHPHARNASVEFDTATLAPTFRLRYDEPGQSYALTIAARLGLPGALIERAQTHRTEHATRLSELLTRLDAHHRTEAERTRALERREQDTAARLAAATEAEARARADAEARVARARTEAAALPTEARRTVSAELDRLKRAERSRTALQTSRSRLAEAAARVAPPTEVSPEERERLVPGTPVTADHLGLKGELLEIAGTTGTIRSGAMTVRVPLAALRPARGAADRPGATGMRGLGPGTAAAGAHWGVPREPGRGRAAAGTSADRTVDAELHLLGRTTDEARGLVERYLDDAFMAGLPSVRLIHGKGTGALRKAVRDLLAGHPLVESYRDGDPREGGTGATVAALKVS
jgi:DNA mismatch repair protein MutS2